MEKYEKISEYRHLENKRKETKRRRTTERTSDNGEVIAVELESSFLSKS